MTSRAEHYREAERLLAQSMNSYGARRTEVQTAVLVAKAQVHATLATAERQIEMLAAGADSHERNAEQFGQHAQRQTQQPDFPSVPVSVRPSGGQPESSPGADDGTGWVGAARD